VLFCKAQKEKTTLIHPLKKDNDEQQTNKEAALLASTVRGD
jgi:hypothetical protein